MEEGFDLTEFGEFYTIPFKINVIVLGHLKRLYRILLRLKPGKPFLLPEEPGEGIVEVLVRALERLRVDFLEPRVFFFEDGKAVVQVEAGEFSTFLFVCPDFLLQRMVVHKPTGMDVLHERCRLLPIGIHPILVGLEHTSSIRSYNKILFLVIA